MDHIQKEIRIIIIYLLLLFSLLFLPISQTHVIQPKGKNRDNNKIKSPIIRILSKLWEKPVKYYRLLAVDFLQMGFLLSWCTIGKQLTVT